MTAELPIQHAVIGLDQPSMADVGELARRLSDHGSCVLQGHYDLARVGRIREALTGIYRDLGEPTLYSKKPRWIGEDVEISGTGLVIHKLLGVLPELQRDFLDEVVVQVIRGALGGGARLELAAAVVVDASRPFFKWHNHVGGIDDEIYRRRGLRPAVETPERTAVPERIAVIVYLDEMGPGMGQLLIHPERVGAAADAPGPIHAREWEGQLAVAGPPGTVVMMDQTTWHAVLPRAAGTGLRLFFGLWFASATAPASVTVDETLTRIERPSALLRSLLRQGGHA